MLYLWRTWKWFEFFHYSRTIRWIEQTKCSKQFTLSCRTPLTVQFARVIKFQSQSYVKQQFSLTSGVFTSCPKQSFMTSWHVFLSKSNIFGPEIFSLDKFWFCGSTQRTLKLLVWHLFYQNILIINDFMNVYEKLIIFIKSLILNIFWWKKCLTIGLKLFWVDLRNQNLSKINISWKKIFQLAKYKWKSEV